MISKDKLNLLQDIWYDIKEDDINRIVCCRIYELTDLINKAREEGRQEVYKAKVRAE